MENRAGTRLRLTAYNAGMGDVSPELAAGIDACLREGGMVLAASERGARSLAAAYHRARRAEGLSAWPAPQIRHWSSFVREAWQARNGDERMVMNALQEQALWAEIVAASGQGRAFLEGPLYRIADLAAEAHELICTCAPRFLREKARSGWQQDAAVFSEWLREFDALCRSRNLLSAARLSLELLEPLRAESSPRPPLLLAGFDRLLPTQSELLSHWGEWHDIEAGARAADVHFYRATDPQTELEACARWCAQRLKRDPEARLLVVTQEVAQRRGEMERAFQSALEARGAASLFEFSLGVPLQNTALVRAALLLLRWLTSPLQEHEMDWLFSSGYSAESSAESGMLTGFMRSLRRVGRQRIRWALQDFLAQRCGAALPPTWATRMLQAKRSLEENGRRPLAPLAWAEWVPRILQEAGWPGARPLNSAEFQVMRRWQQTVDACASLGYDGRGRSWNEFLVALHRAAAETLFSPESQDAPIQIAGPAEAAGLRADAVWFMGVSEDAWPPPGSTNPFIPFAVQRETAMPHASPQTDLELAGAITQRLLRSGSEICLSYPRQRAGVDCRPARLIRDAAGEPEALPPYLLPPAPPVSKTAVEEDYSRVPLAGDRVAGGSTVLTAQSQCPFKAFATARLGAQAWDPAQAGLTAAQRGQLLHEVLHSVWAGPPSGIRTHAELMALPDVAAFAAGHVRQVFAAELPAGVQDCMPRRYLELEEIRLARLIAEWLQYERERVPFAVEGTEEQAKIAVGGLELNLRLDRIDRLADDSCLIVDYKTGDVSVNLWATPRPEDVQLPLYALFALDHERQRIGGLAFAKVRAGKCCLQGKVWNAKEHLHPGLRGTAALLKAPLTLEDLDAWRSCIEDLARDFVAGVADVDPRRYPETCDRCDLQAVCRVHEFEPVASAQDQEAGDE